MAKKKSRRKPKIEVSKQRHNINGSPRDGLVEIHREVYPDTEEGALQSWIDAASRAKGTKVLVIDRLNDILSSVENMLDDWRDPQFQQMAVRFKDDLERLRYMVDGCKQEDPALVIVQNAVDLIADSYVLAVKRYERDTIRGSESSFNHNGATEREQMKHASSFHKLRAEGMGYNEAVRVITEETGAKRTTVRGWIEKYPEKL